MIKLVQREKETRKTSPLREFFQWVQAIVFAVIIALLIRGFIFEPVLVDGHSMENTLKDQDKLILYKLDSFFNQPKYGDIVVVQIEQGTFKILSFLNNSEFAQKVIPSLKKETDYIKRVIGLPDDIIDIKDGYVYRNGEKLEELYIKDQEMTFAKSLEMPVTIPEGKIFVMGDNRLNSNDSREIGFIDISKIRGKAVFRIFPFSTFGKIK